MMCAIPQVLHNTQNARRHKFFNTNNLWLNLEALQETLTSSGGFLPLPLIKNKKASVSTDEWIGSSVLCVPIACDPILYCSVLSNRSSKHHNLIHRSSVCVCSQTVNPRDSKSAPVFQLETAMGSAVECFDKTGVCLCVSFFYLCITRTAHSDQAMH